MDTLSEEVEKKQLWQNKLLEMSKKQEPVTNKQIEINKSKSDKSESGKKITQNLLLDIAKLQGEVIKVQIYANNLKKKISAIKKINEEKDESKQNPLQLAYLIGEFKKESSELLKLITTDNKNLNTTDDVAKALTDLQDLCFQMEQLNMTEIKESSLSKFFEEIKKSTISPFKCTAKPLSGGNKKVYAIKI